MALHINTQIGTDKGITSDGYVRINRFEIQKDRGIVRVFPKLYMSADTAASASGDSFDLHNPAYTNNQWDAKNHLIKETYEFPVTSSVVREREYTRTQLVSSSVEQEVPDADNPGQVITESVWNYENQIVSGTEEYNVDIIDISPITGSSIYDFAYPLLAYELGIHFGFDNIESI
jgi:hypothetical protein